MIFRFIAAMYLLREALKRLLLLLYFGGRCRFLLGGTKVQGIDFRSGQSYNDDFGSRFDDR